MLRLHLDTDIGGDIDDLCALALALGWPGVELAGLTTVAEHGGKRAGYARYALSLAGREGVEVAAGAEAASGCYRSWPTLPVEEAYWPEPVAAAPGPLEGALDLLEESIGRGAVVVAVGPLTNLALLERRRPGVLGGARLCLMGGYVFPPREGFPRWGGEDDYNLQVDVESAEYVLRSSSPTLVTLASTAETSLRREHLGRLRSAGPLARLIAGQAEAFAAREKMDESYGSTCRRVPEDIINFQHDALACAVALGWEEGLEFEEVPLKTEVEGGWLRQRVEEGGRAARVLKRVDGRRFDEFWLDAVTREGGPALDRT